MLFCLWWQPIYHNILQHGALHIPPGGNAQWWIKTITAIWCPHCAPFWTEKDGACSSLQSFPHEIIFSDNGLLRNLWENETPRSSGGGTAFTVILFIVEDEGEGESFSLAQAASHPCGWVYIWEKSLHDYVQWHLQPFFKLMWVVQ